MPNLTCTGPGGVGTLLLAVAVTPMCAGDPIENPSFEQGLSGWETTFDQRRETRCEAVDGAGVDGGRCVRFTVANPFSRTTLEQTIVLPDPAQHHVLSFSVKTSSPGLQTGVRPYLTYRDAKDGGVRAAGEGWIGHYMVPFYLYLYAEQQREGWQRRTYWLPPAKGAVAVRFVLEVQCEPGEVLVDAFDLTAAPPREKPADLLHYVPFLNCGEKPCIRLGQLARAKSPFLTSGDLYHAALMALTDAQERLERLERADFYADRQTAAPLRKRFDEALRDVSRLYEAYAEIYFAQAHARLDAEFDPRTQEVADAIRGLTGDIDAGFADLARAQSLAWGGPKDLTGVRPVEPVADKPLRRLIFSSHSMHHHFGMERRLGDFRQIRWDGRLGPKYDPKTKTFDWAYAGTRLESMRKLGVKHFLTTAYPMRTGDVCVQPEFAAAHADDPEVYIQSREFKLPEKRPGFRGPFNYFNPAVRASAAAFAHGFAAEFKKLLKPGERLIYVVNWEDLGPYTAKGALHMTGYGATARREFQAHLKRKYGSIAALNQAHRADYKSFDEIAQPESDLREPWGREPSLPRTDPLRHDFSKWTHVVHAGFGKQMYEAIKRADPDAIVFSDYYTYGIVLGFDPLLPFQGCDWLQNHGPAWAFFLPQSAMLASLRPYHGKQLATFEDHWAHQDDVHRPGDEIARRLNIIRHMGRLASRGFLFQSWWYSYCDGAFVVGWGSANWADPAFDLSIFRYCSTGIRTGIERARRFERQFADTVKVRSRIVLIVPEATAHHQFTNGKTHAALCGLYRLLYGANRRFEFLPEKLVASGRAPLDEYVMALVPFAPYFPPGLWEKITPWIERGGTLLAVGPCGLYDQFGFDIADSPVRPLIEREFPEEQLNTRATWTWDNGPVIKTRKVGQGAISLVSAPIADVCTHTTLRNRLLDLFAKVPIPATSPDTPAEVELRTDSDGTKYVFALNPATDVPIDGTILAQGRFGKIEDLGIPDGFPVDARVGPGNTTACRFRLAPGQYTFFRLSAPK